VAKSWISAALSFGNACRPKWTNEFWISLGHSGPMVDSRDLGPG